MPLVLSTNRVPDLATGRCRSCPKNFRDTCYTMRTVCVSLYIYGHWTPKRRLYQRLRRVWRRCLRSPHESNSLLVVPIVLHVLVFFFPGIVPIYFPVKPMPFLPTEAYGSRLSDSHVRIIRLCREVFSWGLPPPKMDLRLYDGRLTDYLGEAVVWTVICWLQHKIAL